MIRDAFVALLHEKPFEKITATDIINRSGLNRSTFYAHYPDVRGIIDEITGEICAMFCQMLAEMDFSRFLNDPDEKSADPAGIGRTQSANGGAQPHQCGHPNPDTAEWYH